MCRLLALVFALVSSTASAQWQTENYTLRAGWNAIWLPLDVSHASLEELVPASVDEVWRWNATQAGTFTQVPTGSPSQTELQWSVWRRVDPAGSNLSAVDSNYAYLIRVAPGTATFTWAVKGKPVAPRYDWNSNGVNLVGFPIETPPSSSTRNLGRFFGFDPVLKSLPATLFYNGGELSDVAPKNPLVIGNPNSFQLQRHQAYWVQATSFTEYYGPLKIEVSSVGGLRFGADGLSVSLRVKNVVDISRNQSVTVTLAPVNSETAPAGQNAMAGPVPLLLRGAVNLATGNFSYAAFSSAVTRTLAPGAEEEFVFTVNRSQLGNLAGVSYGSLLRITDSLNLTRIMLPVSAETASRSGLWAGAVVLDKVDFRRGQTTSAGEAAPSLFPLRLLLHSDASGTARLLQQAYIGSVAGAGVVSDKASGFAAPAKPSGRLSSAYFPLGMRLQGSGTIGLSGTVSFTLPLDYRDSSNPFVHPYHPDHDNKDERFAAVLPAGRESNNITRQISMTFASQNPAGFDPSWGSSTLGGTYTETITGLRSAPITCSGTFMLRRHDTAPTFVSGTP